MIASTTKKLEEIPQVATILRLVHELGLDERKHALKLLTLTLGMFSDQDLAWAVKFSVRCLNNFLDREFLKISIRTALKRVREKPELEESFIPMCYPKSLSECFWGFHGKRVRHLMPGGWRVIEAEASKTQPSQYNLHIHVLCQSKFIPQPLISVVWQDVASKPWNGLSRSSAEITDIRDFRNTDRDILRVSKYFRKSESLSKDARFRHLRLYSRFGSWYDLKATNREAVGRTSSRA